LRSIVLYGSAAEGRLRATSDVNVIVVLSAFARDKVDAVRERVRVDYAAIRLSPMFVLGAELAEAETVFAMKFGDVIRRHRVLFGDDPFRDVAIPRAAVVARLRQSLLNLVLRLRELYVLRSLREEQASRVVAEMAGPLRTAAATLLELEGGAAESPKAALEQIARDLPSRGDATWSDILGALSTAREEQSLPPGTGAATLFALIELADALRARAAGLGAP
jgi:predicted nucleotidyltransferase